MKKSGKLVTLFLALFMVVVTVLPAFAYESLNNKWVYVAEGKKWSMGYTVSRTGAFSYAGARCENVYPSDSTRDDDFERIQCRIVDRAGQQISKDSYTVLKEGERDYTRVYIQEGKLTLDTIFFQFRGNNSMYDAYAVVSATGY